jgi:hypothetical protein
MPAPKWVGQHRFFHNLSELHIVILDEHTNQHNHHQHQQFPSETDIANMKAWMSHMAPKLTKLELSGAIWNSKIAEAVISMCPPSVTSLRLNSFKLQSQTWIDHLGQLTHLKELTVRLKWTKTKAEYDEWMELEDRHDRAELAWREIQGKAADKLSAEEREEMLRLQWELPDLRRRFSDENRISMCRAGSQQWRNYSENAFQQRFRKAVKNLINLEYLDTDFWRSFVCRC